MANPWNPDDIEDNYDPREVIEKTTASRENPVYGQGRGVAIKRNAVGNAFIILGPFTSMWAKDEMIEIIEAQAKIPYNGTERANAL